MRSSSCALVWSVVLLLVVYSLTTSEATLSCTEVIKDLRPCVTYLSSGSGQPPAACCSGVKALVAAAVTSEDKKAACTCIKNTSKSLTINAQLAQALPSNCGITLSISISPNADCSK